MLISIAWRNLWRNKRRTIITIASIFFATLIAILVRSLQLGYYNNALNSLIEHFSGHIQIQQRDYWFNPNINNVLAFDKQLEKTLATTKGIKTYIPRLESGALATSRDKSKFAQITGIDVIKENKLSQLEGKIAHYKIDSLVLDKLKNQIPSNALKKIQHSLLGYYNSVQQMQRKFSYVDKKLIKYIPLITKISKIPGRYLRPNENSIIIGYKLAQDLNTKVGDSVIIIGQGYHGVTAIGKYKIVGLLNFPNSQFNKSLIYMPLSTAANLFSTYTTNGKDTTYMVSYVAINTIYSASILPGAYLGIEKLCSTLSQKLQNKNLRVIGWKDLNKTLYQQIESDNVSGMIMLLVLFIIIGFGVFGTVIMLTIERRKELAVQLALGMRRGQLTKVIIWEIIFMTIIGIIIAEIISLPIIYYGHFHPIYFTNREAVQAFAMFNLEPIMPMELPGKFMIFQPLVILLITALTALYPIFYIKKLKISNVLHN